MPCIICGTEEDVNEKGLCRACAEKLQECSDSSSVLHRLSQQAQHTSAGTGAPDGQTTNESAARDGKTSQVLFQFGQSQECSLRYPFSVALAAAGQIMVLDQPERQQYRVTVYDPEGHYQGVFVRCARGEGPDQLKYPKGIALDLHGNLYVPDAGNNRIQRFDAKGACLGPIGESGEGPGEFSFPCDVEIDDVGSLYVADTYNDRIQKLTAKGILLLQIGDEQGELDGPLGVTVDNQGNTYVADTNHHRVVKYDSEGQRALTLGKEGTDCGEMTLPSDVRVSEDGTIYVADQDNMRIQKFHPEGRFLAQFALESITGGGKTPEGDIAVDDDGHLIVCDKYANRVIKAELYA